MATATLKRKIRPINPKAPEEPTRLKAVTDGQVVGVDREKSAIMGFVVAELGPFRSPGRGEFDEEALKEIVRLGNLASNGLKSRWQHPNESDDGLGKHLGRGTNFRLDNSSKKLKVRADLMLNPTAMKQPPGGGRPYGDYLMELVETDKGAVSSSLVLQAKREYRLNDDGTRQRDKEGNALPPLWRPLKLWATDIVDTGDAVNDLLSVEEIEGLPDGVTRRVSQFLDQKFAGASREVVEARGSAFLTRYLDHRFGNEIGETMSDTKDLDLVVGELDVVSSEEFNQLKGEVKGQNQKLDAILVALQEDRQQREADKLNQKVREKVRMANGPEELAEELIESGMPLEKATKIIELSMTSSRKTATPDNGDDSLTEEDKLRKEFKEHEELHDVCEVSEDEYVQWAGKLRTRQNGSEQVMTIEVK